MIITRVWIIRYRVIIPTLSWIHNTENHWSLRRGAPSVTHQAPRFPLVREPGPKTNKTPSTQPSQRQCLIDLRPTRAFKKCTTESEAADRKIIYAPWTTSGWGKRGSFMHSRPLVERSLDSLQSATCKLNCRVGLLREDSSKVRDTTRLLSSLLSILAVAWSCTVHTRRRSECYQN